MCTDIIMDTPMKSTNNETAAMPRRHTFLDVHTHILPAVDDGAQTEELSVAMLCEERRQADSVFGNSAKCVVVATPHFLSYKMNLDEFLEVRQAGYERLMKELENNDSDEIRNLTSRIDLKLGAEIMVHSDLDKVEGFEKLFLGDSRMLMFEFSEGFFSSSYIQLIERICYKYQAVPVIAHFERYADFMSSEDYQALLGIKNIIFQFNAHFLSPRGSNFILKRFISTAGAFIMKFNNYGAQLVMGSDCHSMGIRKPSCNIGYSGVKQFMSPEDGEKFLSLTDSLANKIIGEEVQNLNFFEE